MELLILLAYASICIAAFALLRIPLNRVSVPLASIGGVILVFALVQVLNFYHPYSNASGQYALPSRAAGNPLDGNQTPVVATGEAAVVAWFNQNSHVRLGEGAVAEVSFDSIPGRVFSARVRGVLPRAGDWQAPAGYADASTAAGQRRIPVLIDITDPRFQVYNAELAGASHAQAAVYGENLQQLALLRKTLLRMSAWLNYLSPIA